MARFWAGRIAVTEHIPGLSAYEAPYHARGRRRVMPSLVWRLGGPLGLIMAMAGDRLVASWTVSERAGLYAPSGSGADHPYAMRAHAALWL
jgi:hypothetical protein